MKRDAESVRQPRRNGMNHSPRIDHQLGRAPEAAEQPLRLCPRRSHLNFTRSQEQAIEAVILRALGEFFDYRQFIGMVNEMERTAFFNPHSSLAFELQPTLTAF